MPPPAAKGNDRPAARRLAPADTGIRGPPGQGVVMVLRRQRDAPSARYPRLEPSDLPTRVLLKMVQLNLFVGADRRPGGELADSELDQAARWTCRAVADWMALSRGCAAMAETDIAAALEGVHDNYELLREALSGRVVLGLKGSQMGGWRPTRVERARLIDWLS
jgi:hypothetical protein